MANHKGSSNRWLKEHFSDPYVKQAMKEGYRSRAVYKLLELQARDRLFKPGMTVIDLGAAPGGWSQVVQKLVGSKGQVIAVDLLPIEPIPFVKIIQGDFTTDPIQTEITQIVTQEKVDWIISDMAPNLSGNESIDIPRAIYLAEIALAFALRIIKPNGGFLTKVFQGEGFDALLAELKQSFKTVLIRKPKASRDRSREIYLVARGLKEKISE